MIAGSPKMYLVLAIMTWNSQKKKNKNRRFQSSTVHCSFDINMNLSPIIKIMLDKF